MFPPPPPPHPVWKPGVGSLSHPLLAFPCLVPRPQNPQAIHTQLRCCMLETCCAAASPVSGPSVQRKVCLHQGRCVLGGLQASSSTASTPFAADCPTEG